MDCVYVFWLLYQVYYVASHVPVAQPVFTNFPTTWKVVENTTVWLPCTVENLGDNVVRWWRGEALLGDSSDHSHPRPPRMRLWINNTLEITNLQRDDSAEYICQVVRKEPWNPLQIIQELSVFYPPEVFPEPSTGSVEVRLGETTEIACLAKGVPTPKVSWKVQDKDVTNDGEKPHVLILQANSPKVAQTYRCTADNGIGDPAVANIKVNVIYKPIAIADINWLHAAPGLHVELMCRVEAEPPARVKWFFEEEEVDAAGSPHIVNYSQGQQHVLQFRNITSEDFGIYRCRATNREGVSEATVELSGRARPAIFKREMARCNNSATLIWEVDSYSPIIDYTLKFRQVPAPDDGEWVTVIVPADGHNPGPLHSKSFTLFGLQSASTYEVVVSSRNRYGHSSPSAPFLFSTEGAEYLINGSPEDESSEETEEENAVALNMNTSQGERKWSENGASNFATSSLFIHVFCATRSVLYFDLFHRLSF